MKASPPIRQDAGIPLDVGISLDAGDARMREQGTLMSQYIAWAITGVFGLVVGVIAGVMLLRGKAEEAKKATTLAEQATADAQRRMADFDTKIETRYKELQLEKRDEVQKEVARLSGVIEKEIADRRSEVKDAERRLRERETQLERRSKNLDAREKSLGQRDAEAQNRLQEAEAIVEQQKQELERVAQLPIAQAREILLQRVEEEARAEIDRLVRQIEEEARDKAEEKARKIIMLAIQRCAVDQTAETAVSVVPLPSDELKGRIIGREGRNIRTFEQLSGCDLIIDDTPEAVVISSFEPVRREIARIALGNLVNDGRIHPARIEDMLNKAKTEVQQRMREAADNASAEANVRLPKPLLEVFGRLLYRTSYGQNILKHSVEVPTIAATIAAELGADVNVAKRAALLHDIGKALDADHEGTHVDLGVELMKRHRESDAVIRAAGEHHLDVGAMTSLESVIVQIADAISSSRPGARRENVETYIKRLQNLERIADSFEGVEKSYAIQAGREVRIVVKPDKVDDLASLRIARDVAQRIQDEMTYPGEIKITVIREMRSVDYAR
ncbi:MAG: ribonuclease Y [Abitibacteriaceae bacterium]|nr:ribonuclease Y [Abditibacteriaceae bacterium]